LASLAARVVCLAEDNTPPVVIGTALVIGANKQSVYLVTARHVVTPKGDELVLCTPQRLALEFPDRPGIRAKPVLSNASPRDTQDFEALVVDDAASAANYQDDAKWQLLGSPHLQPRASVSVAGYSDASPRLSVEPDGHFEDLADTLVRFKISEPGAGKSGGAVLDPQGNLVAVYLRQSDKEGIGVSIEEVQKQFTNWAFPWKLRAANSGAAVPPASRKISLSAGKAHTCCIDKGSAYCWGDNRSGQLGTGDLTAGPRPRFVKTVGVVLQEVSAGLDHTCALDTKGAPWCWGANDGGQLGQPPELVTGSTTPLRIDHPPALKSVTAGAGFTCGIGAANRWAYCWGRVPGQWSHPVPTVVTTDITFKQLSAGYENVCGVAESSQVYCWGLPWTVYGDPPSPTGTGAFETVSANRSFMGHEVLRYVAQNICAISVDQDLSCWSADRSKPEQLEHKKVLSIAVRGQDVMVLTSQYELYEWDTGYSALKSLVRIPFEGQPATVTAGGDYWCMADVNSKAFCWGSDSSGTGTGTQGAKTPVPVLDLF
jgi:alpha-tubulin suppressor-like RCC1 family protein